MVVGAILLAIMGLLFGAGLAAIFVGAILVEAILVDFLPAIADLYLACCEADITPLICFC